MAAVGHGVFQFAPEHILLPHREWGWMRQLARRSTGMADTISAVLNLDRAAFEVDPEQVARLTGVVALAVTPLHNLWPVTVQERALSVKYLRP